MKPGTYTATMYRGEFPVANGTVAVTAGADVTWDVVSTEPRPDVVWRIGDFDGRPMELRNGDKIERMHPADVRMGAWGGKYVVGTSKPAEDFPMALFSKEGGTVEVTFRLAADQVAAAVLRVGTTLSFKGGRPSAKIGGWTGKDPGAPVRLDLFLFFCCFFSPWLSYTLHFFHNTPANSEESTQADKPS